MAKAMAEAMAMATVSSCGSGYGSGYGSGSGSGYGSGIGCGCGNGRGDCFGYGYGRGDGDGYSCGRGDGSGRGDGRGDGKGDGKGDGYGYGYGRGNGDGDGYGYGFGLGFGLEKNQGITIRTKMEKTEMKYKGIELNEFTSEKPVIFDPPKRMLVWDYDDETPAEVEVLAFIPNRSHKVIEQMTVYIHCAEIPEVLCRRATNRELAKWLALGNGQYKVSGGIRIWTEHPYDIGQDDDACSKFIKVRFLVVQRPPRSTLEYLGLED